MKLRIPIFILILGIVTGVTQIINKNTTPSKIESYIGSILFFLIIGKAVFISERSGLNDKKVNLFAGLSVIVVGIIFDLVTL